jgi:hypothetical protein
MLDTPQSLKDAVRVLSLALEDLSSRHAELQALRHRESGFEERARHRIRRIMWDLEPAQKDVARTVLDSVFSEDSEEVLANPPDDCVEQVYL